LKPRLLTIDGLFAKNRLSEGSCELGLQHTGGKCTVLSPRAKDYWHMRTRYKVELSIAPQRQKGGLLRLDLGRAATYKEAWINGKGDRSEWWHQEL
jgi:hypothetical protein